MSQNSEYSKQNVKGQTADEIGLSAPSCCAVQFLAVDSTGLGRSSNTVKRRGGMIPFSFSSEEKDEVIKHIRSLGPQYQNSTVILDKNDIPEDLLDQVSFADLTESEVQSVSRQCLDGTRRCRDRSLDSQSDSCS